MWLIRRSSWPIWNWRGKAFYYCFSACIKWQSQLNSGRQYGGIINAAGCWRNHMLNHARSARKSRFEMGRSMWIWNKTGCLSGAEPQAQKAAHGLGHLTKSSRLGPQYSGGRESKCICPFSWRYGQDNRGHRRPSCQNLGGPGIEPCRFWDLSHYVGILTTFCNKTNSKQFVRHQQDDFWASGGLSQLYSEDVLMYYDVTCIDELSSKY